MPVSSEVMHKKKDLFSILFKEPSIARFKSVQLTRCLMSAFKLVHRQNVNEKKSPYSCNIFV